MPYPRRFGAVDCLDPSNIADATCGDPSSSSNGFDFSNVVDTILNDVTQIIKPGTPAYRPLYTPASTAVGSLFSNPVVLLGIGAAVLLAMKKRH